MSHNNFDNALLPAPTFTIVSYGGGTDSVGSGGSDLSCIPLCRKSHTYYHSSGRDRFEKRFDIDIREIQLKLLKTYIAILEDKL